MLQRRRKVTPEVPEGMPECAVMAMRMGSVISPEDGGRQIGPMGGTCQEFPPRNHASRDH